MNYTILIIQFPKVKHQSTLPRITWKVIISNELIDMHAGIIPNKIWFSSSDRKLILIVQQIFRSDISIHRPSSTFEQVLRIWWNSQSVLIEYVSLEEFIFIGEPLIPSVDQYTIGVSFSSRWDQAHFWRAKIPLYNYLRHTF